MNDANTPAEPLSPLPESAYAENSVSLPETTEVVEELPKATVTVLSTRRADPVIVDAFRRFLERAERGEVIAFAIATQGADAVTGSAYSLGQRGDVAHLCCALDRVKLRLLAE